MPQHSSIPVIPANANKYEVLGVSHTATQEELRIAYRRLALLYHPDRHAEAERAKAGEVFQQIASAYATLANPSERRRYDFALSRNEDFHDGATEAHKVSLADILSGINAYEYMFAEGSVAKISDKLETIVQKSLIAELDEQIVEAWSIPAAPSGAQHKGTFSSGALVLTNLRVLLPYTFTWQETHGNVRTTYTGASMPVLPLPAIEAIVVLAKKRVKRQLSVQFRYKDGEVCIRARKTNLNKLLLVAQLWGISLESREEDAKSAELRWAAVGPWVITLILFAVLLCGAGVFGLFNDGIVDTVADFADWLNHSGVWQWSVLLTAAICARRLSKWMLAYSGMDLAEALSETTTSPQSTQALTFGAGAGTD